MGVMNGEHCYFFALEVAPLKIGYAYKTLPLHCTLLHRFFSRLPPSDIDAKVRWLFAQTKPLLLTPEERIAFRA